MTARFARRLAADCSGSTLIEFAILAPVLFAGLLGVLQIGLAMQAYNSLRGIAGDTARHAVTSYQINTDPSATVLEAYGRGVATTTPYSLISDELTLRVTAASNQRVTGAQEFELLLRYNVPTILQIGGIEDIPISYSRPIFVVNHSL